MIHLAYGQSSSSGRTGWLNGTMLFFSVSRDRAFLISSKENKMMSRQALIVVNH